MTMDMLQLMTGLHGSGNQSVILKNEKLAVVLDWDVGSQAVGPFLVTEKNKAPETDLGGVPDEELVTEWLVGSHAAGKVVKARD